MDYIRILKDSISTSVSINIFNNKDDALIAHLYNSKLVKISLSIFNNNNVNNFSSDRLQNTPELAYPIHNRPRGDRDIRSVEYFQKQIKSDIDLLPPIWLVNLNANNKYILLDGSHRIIACYIENIQDIHAYVIRM